MLKCQYILLFCKSKEESMRSYAPKSLPSACRNADACWVSVLAKPDLLVCDVSLPIEVYWCFYPLLRFFFQQPVAACPSCPQSALVEHSLHVEGDEHVAAGAELMGSSCRLCPLIWSPCRNDHKWPFTVFMGSKLERDLVLLAVIVMWSLQSAVDGTSVPPGLSGRWHNWS